MVVNNSTLEIKQKLHHSLEELTSLKECALLNYPNHLNIGDHLIWLGTLLYLQNVAKIKINYIASPQTYSHNHLIKKSQESPILLMGGGNIGDIYPDRQQFTESIVKGYPNRKIFILPQTIFFRQENKLIKAANIFNNHRQLTIFIRDRYSYEIATTHFNNCKIILCPDLALQMSGLPEFDVNNSSPNQQKSILYMCRQDKETNDQFSSVISTISDLNIEKQDWISYAQNWKMGHPDKKVEQYLAKLYRDNWQRGIMTPKKFIDRKFWLSQSQSFKSLKNIPEPHWQQFSFSMLYSGIQQFKKYDLIITNRLHGHILCLLLNIPHIFLPNSYYKNQGFYEAWSKDIQNAKFVDNPNLLETNIKKLLLC